MRSACLPFLFLLSFANSHAQDVQACASTMHELRELVEDPHFSSRWEEVSMDDGKPLVVSIQDFGGRLRLEFQKTGEGLWAEMSARVCKSGTGLEARVTKEQIHLGPAANWMLRFALANGGVFMLRQRSRYQLQIAAHGWSGRFVPATFD